MTGALWWLLLAVLVGAGGARSPVRRRSTGPRDVTTATPLVLDLVAAALTAGRPVAEALELVAEAAPQGPAESLLRVARMLRLGADPEQAWAHVRTDPAWSSVAAVAARSSASGLRLAAAFERLAADLRAQRTTDAAARAQRAGVLAVLPLAACFLPAFVCLGIVPAVVGIASTVGPSP